MAEETTETQAATTNEGEQTETGAVSTAGDQDQKAAESTTADDKAAEGAPEKYDFKAPEGSEFDAEFLKVYSEEAKGLNLSQEKAQNLIDKLSPIVRQQQEARLEKIRNEWSEASKIDKEFGGDKLDANLSIAKQALDQFGTPELKKLINDSGLGNHPEMIRFFYRAGQAISPDTFVGGQSGGKGSTPKTFNEQADALYAK